MWSAREHRKSKVLVMLAGVSQSTSRTPMLTPIIPLGLLIVLATSGIAAESLAWQGKPVKVQLRPAGKHGLHLTVLPVEPGGTTTPEALPWLADGSANDHTTPVTLSGDDTASSWHINGLVVTMQAQPFQVQVHHHDGTLVQTLTFAADGALEFSLADVPVYGLGGGKPLPRPGVDWRADSLQYDRRGALDDMQPHWQQMAYGSRSPAAVLIQPGAWALYVAQPWGAVDLRESGRGRLVPWQPTPADAIPQDITDQKEWRGKGRPDVARQAPGHAEVFLFDARDPQHYFADFSQITGPATMPPRWALGYQQSHRTLTQAEDMLAIVDGFRQRRIPLDAVIYLGTGFVSRGWNTTQPSLAWNPSVFATMDPATFIDRAHQQNTKVVLHVMPPGRSVLPTLHGTIPPSPQDTLDRSHLSAYWSEHEPLVKLGVDAFWPDEGDWLNLSERLARYRMYGQGFLATKPNQRPWSLVRNGHPGMAQWGAWMWSGDVTASWKSLEAQIAVGMNASVSLTPYWGSDIGGFIYTPELTGELYARWLQFAAFTPSFRGHGQAWRLRLPWGWDDVDFSGEVRRHAPESSLRNPAITPIAKAAIELRYQLLPYTYTLAWEARTKGLPLMRPLWIHHPEDRASRTCADQFEWGRDLLVAPVYVPGAVEREVLLPPGRWYDWWTGAATKGGRTIRRPVDLATLPLYARAGAIIPLDPVRQYTEEPVQEPTTLRIYSGADGEFTLYEDDGASTGYLTGKASGLTMRWHDRERRLTLERSADTALTEAPKPRQLRLELLPDGITRTIAFDGKADLRF